MPFLATAGVTPADVLDFRALGTAYDTVAPYADPPDPVELVRALLDGEALELFRLG